MNNIDTIMLFAAGLGNRMRHLTENSPKTLINILGRPILYYALDLCKSYPFKKIVINTHYLHHKIDEALTLFQQENPNFPEISVIYEDELLETGGAVKNAYKLLGDKPIFTMNTDIVIKSEENVFDHMISKWNSDSMDFLLLMHPYDKAVGYSGLGDFNLDTSNKLVRPDTKNNYDYMFSGLQILKPQKIAKHPLKIFSLREYYLNSDKVIGIPSKKMQWYHATTPDDLVDIELDILANES